MLAVGSTALQSTPPPLISRWREQLAALLDTSPLVAQTDCSVKQQLRSGVVSEIAKAFKLHHLTRREISHRRLKHAVFERGNRTRIEIIHRVTGFCSRDFS